MNGLRIEDEESAGVFFCRGCVKEIRVVPGGGEPESGCLSCGVVEWQRMTPEEKANFFASRAGRKHDVARVFFCMNGDCRKPSIEWKGANISAPCVCGSRAFEELVGPAKIEYLREWERQNDRR